MFRLLSWHLRQPCFLNTGHSVEVVFVSADGVLVWIIFALGYHWHLSVFLVD